MLQTVTAKKACPHRADSVRQTHFSKWESQCETVSLQLKSVSSISTSGDRIFSAVLYSSPCGLGTQLMAGETISDQEVWSEVAKAAQDLYQDYLDLQEIKDLENLPEEQLPLDIERNWNVPTTLEIVT